ncbi:hypothetical protein BD311DRAFT_804399 [Dichomitus squalens]|uniref:HMG box domain-containing protein n=1 Tax=Dichomitus squalens TaxID=114155 RepID=A0A4Q9MX01_9APHY|nr:hypothetical protein BD311DRAFT_804399 [Dichomitus squalens]
MLHRDQGACMASESISFTDTLHSRVPETSGLRSQRITSKVRASSRPRAAPPKSKDRQRVRQPANSFMLFRSTYVRDPVNRVSADGRTKRQEELTKEASVAWRKLSQAERDTYQVAARQKMEDHKAKYPQYWSSRRAKNGRFTHADAENAQGSSIENSQPGHEAMLSARSRRSSLTSALSPLLDAPSPYPSSGSSSSSRDCPTPPYLPLPPLPLTHDIPFMYLADEEGSLYDPVIDAPVFALLFGSPDSWLSVDSSGPPTSAALGSCFGATKETLAPKSQSTISYEDWAFTEGEDLIDPNAVAPHDATFSTAL